MLKKKRGGGNFINKFTLIHSTTQMKWSNFSKTQLSTLSQETIDNMKNLTPIEEIKILVKISPQRLLFQFQILPNIKGRINMNSM